jgi:hypothetical protein
MVPRASGEERILAGLPAEAQPPVLVADKTKLSPTIHAAVLDLDHRIARHLELGAYPPFANPSSRAFLFLLAYRLHLFAFSRQNDPRSSPGVFGSQVYQPP